METFNRSSIGGCQFFIDFSYIVILKSILYYSED